MSLNIIFSEDATDTLLSVTAFVENEWGSKHADKFLKRVYKVLDLTAMNPYMYKASSIKGNVRKGFI